MEIAIVLQSTVRRAAAFPPRRSRVRRRALPAIAVLALVASLFACVPASPAAAAPPDLPSPVVAIHVSENTAALETRTATAPTPTGTGTTGKEWWITSWRYFVAYQSLEEALKADGTPYVEVSDSDIATGKLLTTDGVPRYPIVISLAAEAIADAEIAPLRSYVNAGGFLMVGSSSFTRNPSGTTRGDFALHAEMGLHMTNASLQNWALNDSLTKSAASRLTADIPSGALLWSGKKSYDTSAWGSDTRWVWQVANVDSQVLANGDGGVELATKGYGNGRFIYDAELQPLLGDTGYSSSTFAYTIYRHAVEWAFESAGMPIVKVSPWQYPYDAAAIVRHDLEASRYPGATILNSAQYEQGLGMKGDYYFTTGTLRISPTNPDTRMSDADKKADIDKLRLAVSTYGATVGSHNGGLPNPAGYPMPIDDSSAHTLWHWGPDEALDLSPAGYPSGYAYAQASLQTSFQDIATWMSSSPYAGATGLTAVDNGRGGCGAAGTCPLTFVSPYHNAGRERSHQILSDLGAQVVGEQKVGPFPIHDFSYLAPHTYFSMVGMGVGNWYIGGAVQESLDPYLGTPDMQAAVDWYYGLGGLVNLYGHNDLRAYVSYLAGKPNLWKANAVGVRDWYLEREPVMVTPSFTRAGPVSTATATVTGSTDPQTAVELVIPNWSGPTVSSVKVMLNGSAAPAGTWRTTTYGVKIKVGTTVSTVEVEYGVDTTPPVLTVPADMTVPATGPTGAVVTFTATATDNVDGALTPVCVPASGSLFPVGLTTVSCTATDAAGNTGTASFMVTVSEQPTGGWTQTDWSGGAGQDIWSNPARYQAGTNVETGVPGQVGLAPSTGGGVVFSDDFTRDPADPAPLSPWQTVSGSWTVAGGVLSGTGAYGSMVWDYGNIYYVPPSAPPSDYVVSARVRLTADALGGGIGGRVDPATGAHYAIWLYPPDGGAGNRNNIALVKFSTWTSYSTPAITTFTVDANWHDLRLEFAGARIQASLDGTQLIDYTDPSPLPGSGITVDTYPPGSISVDQVTMTTPIKFGTSGSLVSSAFDAGAGSTWQALSWTASTPAGTTLRLRTRTSATSAGLAGAAWSAWYAASGATIPDPAGRWLQYEADLGTSDPSITPFLYDVTATYATAPVSHTLSGTVTAAGSGVTGAIVYVFDAGTSAYAGNVTTGTGGAFSLTLPSGHYKLWIQTNKAGYPDQAYGPDGTFEHATSIDLTAANQTASVVLLAAPVSHTLSGTVTAAGSGVTGAIVYVFDAGTSAYAGNVTTGTGGAFSLTLPSGHYKLWIQTNKAGYPDQAYGPDGTFEHATSIDLTAANQTASVVLLAAPVSHTLSGTVTAAGSGVTGAIVYVFDAGTSAYAGNVTTGTGGAFSLTLPSGHYKLWIQTNKAGYPDQAYGPDGTFEHATSIDLTAANQTASVVLLAAPVSHTLSGTVTAAGSGVTGAIVYVFDAGTSAYAGNVTTGTGGAFSLTLPSGHYKLWIQTNKAGYPDQAYGPDGTFEHATSIDLTAANQTASVVLLAAPVSHTLSGTVTAAGSGVTGAIVYVFDAGTSAYAGNVTTGTGGAFSLTLPSGHYKLWIQTNKAGYPDQAYGPDGTFEHATSIDLTAANQTASVVLLAAP